MLILSSSGSFVESCSGCDCVSWSGGGEGLGSKEGSDSIGEWRFRAGGDLGGLVGGVLAGLGESGVVLFCAGVALEFAPGFLSGL